jgi:hypothetical protein
MSGRNCVKRNLTAAYCALTVALSGCSEGDVSQKLAVAKPATGAQLRHYAETVKETVRLGANADLAQRFCKNQTGVACSVNIADELKAEGFDGEGSVVDLAAAFTDIEADKLDHLQDHASSTDVFFQAAYRTVLAREPDPAGAQVNLKFLQDGGERKQLLRTMLMSAEFANLQ